MVKRYNLTTRQRRELSGAIRKIRRMAEVCDGPGTPERDRLWAEIQKFPLWHVVGWMYGREVSVGAMRAWLVADGYICR